MGSCYVTITLSAKGNHVYTGQFNGDEVNFNPFESGLRYDAETGEGFVPSVDGLDTGKALLEKLDSFYNGLFSYYMDLDSMFGKDQAEVEQLSLDQIAEIKINQRYYDDYMSNELTYSHNLITNEMDLLYSDDELDSKSEIEELFSNYETEDILSAAAQIFDNLEESLPELNDCESVQEMIRCVCEYIGSDDYYMNFDSPSNFVNLWYDALEE